MPFIGRYYSDMWVRKNILKQTEEEIAEMMDEMSTEKIPLTPPMDPDMPAPPAPIANRPDVPNNPNKPAIPGQGDAY